MNLFFSERGEKKCLLDDLPALTEIPLQTIDSGLEDTFSESPLDKGLFFLTFLVQIVLKLEITVQNILLKYCL